MSPMLFCADFADYPFMQAAALPLVENFELWIGGRSGWSNAYNTAAETINAHYFDWQKYQRLCGFEHSLEPLATANLLSENHYELAHKRFRRALDRVFLKPMSTLEEERYFRGLILAFEAWIKPRASRLVVCFAHNPHFPWHIVFYHVCRRLGVPVVIFKQTQIPDAMLLDTAIECRRENWLKPSQTIPTEQVKNDALAVSPRMKQSIGINVRSEKNAHSRLGPIAMLSLAKRYFRRRHDFATAHYFRQTWLTLIRIAFQRQRDRLADLAYLDLHAEREAPPKQFIYFALHYQPERTTVPEVDHLYDQISAIRMLAAALPDDWQLVVKEHPRQLGDRKPDLRSLHYGRTWLYKAIQTIPGAILMHPFVASSALIARASLTASCNGSAVYEGLQNKIAGLTFVPTWHSACESGPCIDNPEELADGIRRLANKSSETISRDFARFLEAESSYWFEGANDGPTAEKSPRNAVQRLIDCVTRELAYWTERRSEIPRAVPGGD